MNGALRQRTRKKDEQFIGSKTGESIMNSPKMKSFWVDFPLNVEQYSKLDLKWRRRQSRYDVRNPPPDLRIRSFCTFGGDDVRVISLELRGNVDDYYSALEVMDKWIVENLGPH
jgi:hypothetical protein